MRNRYTALTAILFSTAIASATPAAATTTSTATATTESASANPADTVRVLDKLVVVESAAKAPVPLLPLDVRVVGENLTATRYEVNYGFPMPRATVMAGFDLRF